MVEGEDLGFWFALDSEGGGGGNLQTVALLYFALEVGVGRTHPHKYLNTLTAIWAKGGGGGGGGGGEGGRTRE